MVALIARAFAAEPLMNWISGGDRARLRAFAALAVHRIAAPAGEVLVDADLSTAALVLPPGAAELAPGDPLQESPCSARQPIS